MADGRFSPTLLETMFDTHVWSAEKWITGYFADPYTVSDHLTVEVVGGAFARINPAWARTTAYTMTLDEDGQLRALPPGTTLVAIGLCDAPFNGNLIERELLPSPISYPSGGTFPIESGEWVVGLYVPA